MGFVRRPRGWECTGGASGSGGQPPSERDDKDFDDEPGDETGDGSRACPVCQTVFAPGEISCGCGHTPQRKEQKRRAGEARQAAALLNTDY